PLPNQSMHIVQAILIFCATADLTNKRWIGFGIPLQNYFLQASIIVDDGRTSSIFPLHNAGQSFSLCLTISRGSMPGNIGHRTVAYVLKMLKYTIFDLPLL